MLLVICFRFSFFCIRFEIEHRLLVCRKIRVILKYKFCRGFNAAQTTLTTCVTRIQLTNELFWFARFRNRNFNLPKP